MTLYRIEYFINSTCQRIICLSVGENETDVWEDISSVVGEEIKVLSIFPLSEVHRLTGTIKRHIQMGVRKGGRPKKFDWVEDKE